MFCATAEEFCWLGAWIHCFEMFGIDWFFLIGIYLLVFLGSPEVVKVFGRLVNINDNTYNGFVG